MVLAGQMKTHVKDATKKKAPKNTACIDVRVGWKSAVRFQAISLYGNGSATITRAGVFQHEAVGITLLQMVHSWVLQENGVRADG